LICLSKVYSAGNAHSVIVRFATRSVKKPIALTGFHSFFCLV
jgi:hypothetical protein